MSTGRSGRSHRFDRDGADRLRTAQRLITNYTAARQIVVAVAAIPFIPANWRAVITALVVMLDEVSPSFKAGKDLAIGDGTISTMEPKLPA